MFPRADPPLPPTAAPPAEMVVALPPDPPAPVPPPPPSPPVAMAFDVSQRRGGGEFRQRRYR